MGGLKRGTPEEASPAEKITHAMRYLANNDMKMNLDKPWMNTQSRENDRESIYIGTNVTKFTDEQRAAIKTAIMAGDKNKDDKLRNITDVTFEKGRDGTVVIKVVSPSLFKDFDQEKLIKSMSEQKDKFKDVETKLTPEEKAKQMPKDTRDAKSPTGIPKEGFIPPANNASAALQQLMDMNKGQNGR